MAFLLDRFYHQYSNIARYGHDDVLHMSSITIDKFLKNIQLRYQNGIYYTNIGDVCISVNPNIPNLSIYSDEHKELYYRKGADNLPPHLFATASVAHKKIFEQNTDCSIIITGESGSGKTEASKLFLLYSVYAINRNEQILSPKSIFKIENILIKSNCILESFGNAKTVCNDNSSRFGKYTEITFVSERDRNEHLTMFEDIVPNKRINKRIMDSYGHVCSYLLEKCRVIEQQDGERNFHSFYQLLSAINTDQYSQLFSQLKFNDDAQTFRYLNNNSKLLINENDRTKFDQVYASMIEIGFSLNEIETIYKILLSILYLGNIEFENIPESGDNKSAFIWQNCIGKNSHQYLMKFVQLMCLDIALASKTLCTRSLRTPSETVCKTLNPNEASYGRDALAKVIYQKLFAYILKRINEFLKSNQPSNENCTQANTIGILDIYGFEVFYSTPNGFEQFLINYCNEKLHQLFIDLILRKEQQFYEKEDIDWKMITYEDNSLICELIDKKHFGMFALFDQASALNQQYTDEELLNLLEKHLNGNKYFETKFNNPTINVNNNSSDFLIRHFAGNVHYCINGFVEKNSDKLYYDYYLLLEKIDDPIIHKILYDPEDRNISSIKRPVTAGYQFRKSMQSLMNKLAKNQQLFVRCIKPCDNLNAGRFNADKVRHQIQYLGLIENSKLRQAGFWRRYHYNEFVQRFKMLCNKEEQCLLTNRTYGISDREYFKPICQRILLKTGLVNPNDFVHPNRLAFGKTILFLRDPELIEKLEIKRVEFLEMIMVKIQTLCRIQLAVKHFQRLKQSKLLFELYYQLKRLEHFDVLFFKFDIYFNRYQNFISTQKNLETLDFKDIEQMDSLAVIFENSLLFRNNNLYNKILPEMIHYLNEWLILVRFSVAYWIEKALRMEAREIFHGNKIDWGGNEKRHWKSNYLIESRFKVDSKLNRNIRQPQTKDYIQSSVFSSYILTIGPNLIDKLSVIMMNNQSIFQVNINNMNCKEWLAINQIDSISLTTGKDQLIVLHNIKPEKDDLIFSFCAIKETDNANNLPEEYLIGNKVGEFVTLLRQHYEALTGNKLTINFSDSIKINLKNGLKNLTIRAIEFDSEEYLNMANLNVKNNINLTKKFANVFNWNNFNYSKLFCLNLGQSNSRKEFIKRIEYQKLSDNQLVLLYE